MEESIAKLYSAVLNPGNSVRLEVAGMTDIDQANW